MKRNRIRAAVAAAILAICAGNVFAQGSSLEAIDSAGAIVRLSKPAARVVSLGPAPTEMLFAVGAKVVGVTSYCLYPPEAASLPKIGGFSAQSMSLEKILSLRPELVVSSGAVHREIAQDIARYGIPVYVYDPADFEGIAAGLEALGRLTGNEARGKAEAADFRARLASIRKVLEGLPESKKPKVFWEVYDEPLMTCGLSTFQHAIVEAAGGRDIFSDLKTPWPVVSSEEIVARAPEVIMAADDHEDKLTLASLAKRPGWASVPAIRTGRVVLLPTALVSVAGPRVVDGVRLAAKFLHPELFR
ncbi:MAG TPA: cobalamin-binding protein [Rectinemataceae bacterium]